jgi:lysophospholipase L1-like esterase
MRASISTQPRATRPGAGRRVAYGVVVLVVGLMLAVAVGEVGTRALDLLDRLNGYSRLLFVAGPSEELPYGLRPGVETTFIGTRVRVNREGCRGPELDGSQRPRVLALGDSVVFGMGVSEDEAVSGRLEARLATRATPSWEIVNCGVPGFDTLAEARQLARLTPLIRPSITVVGLSLNDYDRAPRYHPLGVLARSDGADASLVDRSEFLMLLRWLATWARGGLWQQKIEQPAQGVADPDALRAGLDRLVASEHAAFYAAPDRVAWKRLETGLRQLKRAAKRAHSELLVAIFPESWQLGAASPDLRPQRALLAACAAAGVRCLDLHPAFAAAGGDLFRDAQHPNARGHDVAAAAIAAAVQRAP